MPLKKGFFSLESVYKTRAIEGLCKDSVIERFLKLLRHISLSIEALKKAFSLKAFKRFRDFKNR